MGATGSGPSAALCTAFQSCSSYGAAGGSYVPLRSCPVPSVYSASILVRCTTVSLSSTTSRGSSVSSSRSPFSSASTGVSCYAEAGVDSYAPIGSISGTSTVCYASFSYALALICVSTNAATDRATHIHALSSSGSGSCLGCQAHDSAITCFFIYSTTNLVDAPDGRTSSSACSTIKPAS